MNASEVIVFKWFIFLGVITPYIQPQLSGMLGAFSYIIARHELKLPNLSILSNVVVLFFGWMGAWATVNVLADYESIGYAWTQVISTIIGFIAYDTILMFARHSNSIIEFFAGIITEKVKKWNK